MAMKALTYRSVLAAGQGHGNSIAVWVGFEFELSSSNESVGRLMVHHVGDDFTGLSAAGFDQLFQLMCSSGL
jgi:hypothetical protein